MKTSNVGIELIKKYEGCVSNLKLIYNAKFDSKFDLVYMLNNDTLISR